MEALVPVVLASVHEAKQILVKNPMAFCWQILSLVEEVTCFLKVKKQHGFGDSVLRMFWCKVVLETTSPRQFFGSQVLEVVMKKVEEGMDMWP